MIQVALRVAVTAAIRTEQLSAAAWRASASVARAYAPTVWAKIREYTPQILRAVVLGGSKAATAVLRPIAARMIPSDVSSPLEVIPAPNEVWLPEFSSNPDLDVEPRRAALRATLRAQYSAVSISQPGQMGPIRVGGRPSASQKRYLLAATGQTVTVHTAELRTQAQADRANRIWGDLFTGTISDSAMAGIAAAAASQALDDTEPQLADAWRGAITT